MLTLNPLRSAITGLCLFAGIASAQAALTMTFEQDDNTGVLTISFGGQQAVPFTSSMPTFSGASFFPNALNVQTSGNFWNPGVTEWTLQGTIPWTTSTYLPAVSFSGAGGFAYSPDGNFIQVYSTTNAAGQLAWDGTASYSLNLADIGLADGQTGSFGFTNGTDSITIDWSAIVIPAVPEPATYAVVLGLGVAGVALLRRRARS